MLRIRIDNLAAWEELKSSYGVKPFANLQSTFRKVIPKLLREDDMLEFVLPISFFSGAYQNNIWAFIQHLNMSNSFKLFASRRKASKVVIIRAGYDIPSFGFAKNLTRELKKPHIHSVDVLMEDIPDAYLSQIHHFLHRLTNRLGVRIKRLVLGDTIRFYKPSPIKKHAKPTRKTTSPIPVHSA